MAIFSDHAQVPRKWAALTVLIAAAACSGGHKAAVIQLRPRGGAVSAQALTAAANVLRARFNAAHIHAAVTATDGRIDVKGDVTGGQVRGMLATGDLTWRQVLGIGDGSSASRPGQAGVVGAFEAYRCQAPASPQGVDNDLLACDREGTTKYLLGPTALQPADIADSAAAVNTTTNQWLVMVVFSRAGADRWYQLTKDAYEADPAGDPSGCQNVNVSRGCNEVGVVLDGVVLSAPSSQQDGIRGGETQITGPLSKQAAVNLAGILRSGPLPFSLALS